MTLGIIAHAESASDSSKTLYAARFTIENYSKYKQWVKGELLLDYTKDHGVQFNSNCVDQILGGGLTVTTEQDLYYPKRRDDPMDYSIITLWFFSNEKTMKNNSCQATTVQKFYPEALCTLTELGQVTNYHPETCLGPKGRLVCNTSDLKSGCIACIEPLVDNQVVDQDPSTPRPGNNSGTGNENPTGPPNDKGAVPPSESNGTSYFASSVTWNFILIVSACLVLSILQ